MDTMTVKKKNILRTLKKFACDIDSVSFKNENQVFELMEKCELVQEKIYKYEGKIAFDSFNPYDILDYFGEYIIRIHNNVDKGKYYENKEHIRRLMAIRKVCLQKTSFELRQLEKNDHRSERKTKRVIKRELLEDLDQFICNLDNEDPSKIHLLLEECTNLEKRICRLKSVKWSKYLKIMVNLRKYLTIMLNDANLIHKIHKIKSTGDKLEARKLLEELKKEGNSNLQLKDISKEIKFAAECVENIYEEYIYNVRANSPICKQKIRQIEMDAKEDKKIAKQEKQVAKAKKNLFHSKMELNQNFENTQILEHNVVKDKKMEEKFKAKPIAIQSSVKNIEINSSYIGNKQLEILNIQHVRNYQIELNSNNTAKMVKTIVSNGIDEQIIDTKQLPKYIKAGYNIIGYGFPGFIFYDVKDVREKDKTLKIS